MQTGGTVFSGEGTLRATGATFRYDVRLLDPSESRVVAALHRHVVSLLPPKLYLYERDERFFRDCLDAGGCVVGAFHGENMIGYATLQRPGAGKENYGEDLGLPPEALDRVGHLAGSAVKAEYRGNGLQRLLAESRDRAAHALGVEHMCGEVVPSNVISIANHLRQGYHLEVDKVDRFDLVCFVLHKRLSEDPRSEPSGQVFEVPAGDLDECRVQFRAGRCGFEVVRPTAGAHIRFSHFAHD